MTTFRGQPVGMIRRLASFFFCLLGEGLFENKSVSDTVVVLHDLKLIISEGRNAVSPFYNESQRVALFLKFDKVRRASRK